MRPAILIYWKVQMRRQRGFTLIELLVVIAIIAVLASLLLAALSNAKFQARNTICKNNLRQIGLGLQMYVSEYEAYPPFFNHVDGTALESTALMWDQFLEPYLFPTRTVLPFLYASGTGPGRKVEKFFLCPFFATKRPNMPFEFAFHKAPIYGYNGSGVGDFLGLGRSISMVFDDGNSRFIRESAVVAPSQMTAAGDPFARAEKPELDGSFVSDPWRPWPPNSPALTGDRIRRNQEALRIHRRRMNRVFCDGHVGLENFRKAFSASDDYLRRWNHDNEPHREVWTWP
jgi:prepilin-type N-terminal cleavage/methylation domain-containing protein/prepilin-type processing-associated H-X9-DG protein